ncbi:MAG: NAD(P)-dependent oxidoreductase [Bacteroidales bacterium]
MKILVVYNIPKAPFTNLPNDWLITFPQEGKECFEKEEIIALLPEYDVLLSIFSKTVDQEMIDAGKKLKIISNFGVGFNNIDIAYARSKNISVCNTPASVANPTAEHAMALMLCCARRIGELNIKIRLQKESLWGTMRNLGHTLENKTLGIIGMGRIGKNLAKKAEAFGMKIIYTTKESEVPGYKKVDLDTLLKHSDFISIHVPLTQDTTHLISKREFGLMKSNAILINTARGLVVDEKALAIALETGEIAGAGLDVFENEPSVYSKLYGLSNVVLTPHVGNGTVEAREATGGEALSNILHFFTGNPSNVVN